MADITNDEANDLADEILGREQFISASEPGLFQRTVDRAFEFVGDIIERLLGAIFGGAGGAAGQTLAIILLVLAVVLLAFAIYRAITQRPPKEEDDESSARVVFDEVVHPDELERVMSQHVASSEWRLAVIAGFRLSIVRLIDANIARENSGATTGDFAKVVETRRPELLDAYQGGARSFERAFYSDKKIHEADLAKVRHLLERLEALEVRT